MKLTENARTVLSKRYFRRDETGKPLEDEEGLFWRVARAIAAADLKFNDKSDTEKTASLFFEAMSNLSFLPNSPTLMNAGRELGQLSACFVLPVGDSMEEIFEAVKQAALIHKSGGGTGFSFSRLRPCGAVVRTTGGVASGPVSFMRVFNMATEAVKQGGTRRGANMGLLRVDHPDILGFIDCKHDNADITNFNISVGITEDFMRAVQAGETYPLIDPKSGEEVKRMDARLVFHKIVEGAWRNGEPGIIFLDRMNADNVVPDQGEIESTNPCGEQPLLPYESCNLGSINLTRMLKNTEDGWQVDFGRLRDVVKLAVHFLDNVIEVNRYPLEQIEKTTKLTRKIGLGVMGWADMLLRMGIPYDSEEAVALAGKVMRFISEEGRAASARLAQERGPFPLFAQSTLANGLAMRNATVTTIAPTGTLSMIAGCSSGVEPVFAYVYRRNVMDGSQFLEVNPILKEILEERGLYSEELMQRVAQQGNLQNLLELPEDIRRVFVCAHDVRPLHHVKMQSEFQKYTDNAVSKTVNFPHDATIEDVEETFTLAYELGCKGVTIYRDGSRDNQVLNAGHAKNQTQPPAVDARNIRPRPRPEVTMGLTERVKTGCGNLYVTVNYDENGVCEVFTSTGKAGGCPSQSEATARLVSIALRSGVCMEELVEQLRGIRCPSTIRHTGMKCTSCPDAIAKVVKKTADMLSKNQVCTLDAAGAPAQPETDGHDRTCPECNSPLLHEGGCIICRTCGYSKCN